MSANKPPACSRCSSALPDGARFCPQCGQQTVPDETVELPMDPALKRARAEERELPQDLPVTPAPSLHRAERRPLGIGPLPFLGGLTGAALVLAIVLWVVAGWLPGACMLVAALALAGLLATALRRQPDAPISQLLADVLARLRDLSAFVASSGRTWSRAGVEVASLRMRRTRLERELRRLLTPLGEAVHQGDQERIEHLRQETAALQRALDELGRREAAVVSSAQSEIERERVPVQPTTAFPPVGPDAERDPHRPTGIRA